MSISLDRPTALSKLDAVNIILRARGKASATSLGEDARTSTIEAEQTLSQSNMSVLQEGWNFNTDRLLLTPDTNSEIYLPNNIAAMEPIEGSASMQITERGGRLYDRYNSTYKFTAPVQMSVSLLLPFDHLPQVARWYIAIAASMDYGNSEVPGDPSLRTTERQLSMAKVALEQYDNRLASNNLREVNPHIYKMRGRR